MEPPEPSKKKEEASDKRTTIVTVLITALASIAVAWITARGAASAQTKQTLSESSGQVENIGNSISAADRQISQLQSELQAVKAQVLPQAVPAGTIIAWYAKDRPIPIGWIICNGSGGTPDLRHRFLRGTGDLANVGITGGAETHDHSLWITLPEGDWKGSDKEWGTTPWANGPNPVKGRTVISENAEKASVLPPFTEVIFLMKE